MFRLTSLILRNVLRNRRRTLLTLASTAVSLALLTLMVAMYQGFFFEGPASPAEARRIICRHRVSLTQSLPASHQQRIKAIAGVDLVSAWTWFGGKFREPKDMFARFGCDSDVIFDIHPDWQISSDQLAAFKRGRSACVISDTIAEREKLKLGDHVQIVGDIYNVTLDLTVAGIYQAPPNNDMLLFHREYLRELLPATSESRDTVGTYLIQADNPDDVPRISKAVDTMFENSPYPTRTESEQEFGRSFLAFLGNIKLFLAAICGAVTFTILLVSANTVAMAVRERTREMAILRTLGYTPGEILSLVLSEAVIISLIGGGIGLGIGALLAQSMSKFGGLVPPVRWQAALIVLGLAAVIGMLSAMVPAMVASRKNIVESLRFTG